VREGNTRVDGELGGGPLYDIGIYCINAARYLFADEPLDVTAFSATAPDDPRFREVEEQYAVAMRFPGNRLATFIAGFGASDCGYYELLGSKGSLRVDPAFEFTEALKHHITIGGKTKTRNYARRDQVAPEIIYFSDCIMEGRPPEPSGVEGLADVRIIRAIQESVRTGRAIAVEPVLRRVRPTVSLEMRVPPHRVPTLVDAEPPTISSSN
jgi:predicted dehydrogenase